MQMMLCGDLSVAELRNLSAAERRAYWFGRGIGHFRRRLRGYNPVYRYWRGSGFPTYMAAGALNKGRKFKPLRSRGYGQ